MQHCPLLGHVNMPCQAMGSVADVWAAEQAALMPLPPAFDGFVEHSKRVSPTCLISFEHEEDQEMIRGIVSPTQGYSVPASFANRPVSLRVYPERLVVVLEARLWRDAAEGQILCEHVRVIQRSHQIPARTIYDWRHYLAVLQRKPGALRNGAPFAEFPPAFKQLQDLMLSKPGGDRDPLARLLCNRLPGNGWSISWRWSCITSCRRHAFSMMNRPCWLLWKWRWPRVSPQKPMC